MGAMEQIEQGMRVVDVTGEEIGTVEDFKIGDPQAASAEGQGQPDDGGLLVDLAATAFGNEPDVDDEQAERLLRLGYIKIDRSGLFGGHAYTAADSIDHVAAGTVHLNARRDQLGT